MFEHVDRLFQFFPVERADFTNHTLAKEDQLFVFQIVTRIKLQLLKVGSRLFDFAFREVGAMVRQNNVSSLPSFWNDGFNFQQSIDVVGESDVNGLSRWTWRNVSHTQLAQQQIVFDFAPLTFVNPKVDLGLVGDDRAENFFT